MAKRRRRTHKRRSHRRHKNPSFSTKARRVYSRAKGFASANNLMEMLKNSAAIVLGIKAPDMIFSKLTAGNTPLLSGIPKALAQIVLGFLARKYGKSKFADLLGTTISAGGVAELIDQTGVLSSVGKFSFNDKTVAGLGQFTNPFLKSSGSVSYVPTAQTSGLGQQVKYVKIS